MTNIYNWAEDPGAFPVRAAPPPPRPVGQLYRVRLVVPAVWIKYQPRQVRALRWDYRHGALQVQWRKPRWRDIFFRRN